MAERWVEATRYGDDARMFINMEQAWVVAELSDKEGVKKTHIFAISGNGLTCEIVQEPSDHFMPPKSLGLGELFGSAPSSTVKNLTPVSVPVVAWDAP